MKNSKLTLVLVVALAGLVPQSALSQTAAAVKADKMSDSKSVTPIQLVADAPTSYPVVKGDTLWSIAGKFLKDPWRWPDIWKMNKEQVKNPHRIYPGDVIQLAFDANGNPILSFANASSDNVKLSPRLRQSNIDQAIPSIPSREIAPFLSLPRVIEEGALLDAPRIVGTEDNRVIAGAGNIVYVLGMQPSQGERWQIYRPGKALKNPAGEVLGFEANYLGEAKVVRFGESSSVEILRSSQEIVRGDRLTPISDTALPAFIPHSPGKALTGTVISVLGGVETTAQYAVVTLDLGKRDGIEVGHVMATLRKGATVPRADPLLKALASTNVAASGAGDTIKLPDERNGLLFVFRTFEKVSYALVMSTRRPLNVGDAVQTP